MAVLTASVLVAQLLYHLSDSSRCHADSPSPSGMLSRQGYLCRNIHPAPLAGAKPVPWCVPAAKGTGMKAAGEVSLLEMKHSA